MLVQPAPELATRTITPLALAWVASARRALESESELRERALAVNFAWERATERAHALAHVASHFARIEQVLAKSDSLFCAPWPWDVRRWFGSRAPPAYTFEGRVYFTEEYRTPFEPREQRGFGLMCLTAMMIHECVHVFDPRSGEPEIHVSEWDEPRFSTMSTALQLHNPSAYASFAGQVHHERLDWPVEERYGAGRRAD